MSQSNEHLFCTASLSDFLIKRDESLGKEIDQFGSDYILKVSLDDLTEHLSEKYRLEHVVLFRDQIHIGNNGDTKVDVRGDPRYASIDRSGPCFAPAVFVEFVVPFSGDSKLFQLAPNTGTFNPPRGQIIGQELRFRYTRTDHDASAIRAEFDHTIECVAKYVEWGAEQIDSYNKSLPSTIKQRLDYRKEKFLKDLGMVQALGFPIKPRAGASTTYNAPVTRKNLPISMPAVKPGSFKPEPVLETEEYERILEVVSNMVLVMERSPGSFSRLDEEGLRTHILVQLNGHYEGQATGETFNSKGKTDILIRAEDRNIFIAECKFWKGAESFKATIDQLLGYLAWRDTKAAIIIFNRNKDTSAVVKQIPGLVVGHPNYKRNSADYKSETGFRFVLHNSDDKNRELILTVLVFDVPE